jgi:hypothetical protein
MVNLATCLLDQAHVSHSTSFPRGLAAAMCLPNTPTMFLRVSDLTLSLARLVTNFDRFCSLSNGYKPRVTMSRPVSRTLVCEKDCHSLL